MSRAVRIITTDLAARVSAEFLRDVLHSEHPHDVLRRSRILARHGANVATLLRLVESLEGASLDLDGAA